MRRTHLVKLAALLMIAASSACASAGGVLGRTIAVTQCVMEDERLSVAVLDPKQAREWLLGVRAELKAIIATWKGDEFNGDFSREFAVAEDLLDLIDRLEVCMTTEEGVNMAHIEGVERVLANLRPI